MWGLVPAAGRGSRIQPLAFSKELLPLASQLANGDERPCAVSEYLLNRMLIAGVDKICFIISAGKSDIMEYFGGSYGGASIAYVVQPEPHGLCDALFRAVPLIHRDEPVVVGLPDTIWFPEAALKNLPDHTLAFLLFPVRHPELFDTVVLDPQGRVREIQVKKRDAASEWIWGAFRMPGHVFAELSTLWNSRLCQDEYVGSLVNAYLAAGGEAIGVKAGHAYVDVGTLHGYRAAMELLSDMATAKLSAATADVIARWGRQANGGQGARVR